MALRLTGLTGLNTYAWVQEMIEIQRQGLIAPLEKRKTVLETRQKGFETIRGLMDTLKSKLQALQVADATFRARTVTVVDAQVASVTVKSGAALGSYSLVVHHLAQSQSIASDVMADPNTALGLSGSFQLNGKTITVEEGDSLNKIRDRINQADAGVTALIQPITDAEGTKSYRLILSAAETGTENQIQISADTGVLAALGVLTADGEIQHEVQAARDASFSINGLLYSSSTNTVADLIPGVTFTLKQGNEAATSFTVSENTGTALQAVKEFISAYNAVIAKIDELTQYNKETNTAYSLNGDPLARQLKEELRKLLFFRLEGVDESLNQLSDLGIRTGAWGTADYGKLVVDEERFLEKVKSSPFGVAQIFQAIELDFKKLFDTKRESLASQIKDIDDQITRLNERLENRQRMLENQFLQMELAVSNYSRLSAALSNQLSALSMLPMMML